MAPHEYYMLHIVPVRGGQSEVPSLIHNGVLMYMRMVTEEQNPEAPLVCAPAGLRRPYAHTSDTRSYYEMCNLSNSQSTTTVTDFPRNGRAHQHYRYL